MTFPSDPDRETLRSQEKAAVEAGLAMTSPWVKSIYEMIAVWDSAHRDHDKLSPETIEKYRGDYWRQAGPQTVQMGGGGSAYPVHVGGPTPRVASPADRALAQQGRAEASMMGSRKRAQLVIALCDALDPPG